jgi:hypothetical protein
MTPVSILAAQRRIPSRKDTGVRPLVEQLSFIKDKRRWGFLSAAAFSRYPKRTSR